MYQSRISIILDNIKTYIKNFVEKSSSKQDKEVDFSEQRKLVGRIIIAAMTEQISVQRGLLLFPKGCEDPSIRAAWHALCHYEADEDIKAKDIEYNNSQIELLEMIAFAFKDGEPLAQNIIDAYEPYYKDSPISYEKGLRGFLKKFTRFLNSF